MSPNLLELTKEFCLRRALPLPTAVMTSQDDQLYQIVGLLNEVLEDLTTRYVGTAFHKTASWQTTGQESQGQVEDLCPFGYKWIINNTFWDRTQQLPVRGPISASDWQALKGTVSLGVYLQYRVVGGELLLNGTLTPGHTLALEYASDWAVKSVDGVFKPGFSVDTDVCIFPRNVILAGLNWKWRLEKGLSYAEAFRTYEIAVTEFNGHDGGKPTLSMDGGSDTVRPAIMIPTGNWNL